MDLDIFNKIIDSAKENSTVQNFVKELSELLYKNTSKTDTLETKNTHLMENLQECLTSVFRDKMSVERNNILNNYAKETTNQGTMYYIYSKNSTNEDKYNLTICEEGKSHEVLIVEKNDLPENVGVGSVLRYQEGKFILDEKATEDIQIQIENMINNLLEQQSQYLSDLRTEGHIYEVVEVSKDRVTLLDRTNNDGFCFEEIEFSEKNLEKASPGAIFEYVDGEYRYIRNNN